MRMAKTAAHKQLDRVCKDFGVEDVYELAELYRQRDQENILNQIYDITNDSLVHNAIKNALLSIGLSDLPDDEQKMVKDILWLWFHHAATIALWQQHDLLLARTYCDTALLYLYPEHPNRITPMLGMLLHGDIDGAKKWAREEVGEIEREYADYLLAEYEKGTFNERPSTQSVEGER